MSLYLRTKDCPNHSTRLLSYMKSNPNRRIMAWIPQNKLKRNIVKTPLSGLCIEFCNNGKSGPTEWIIGKSLRSIIYATRRGVRSLNIDKVYLLDITDRFIEEYNKIGACSFSDGYHEFEIKSPRVKICKFCNYKEKKITLIKKETKWVKA